MLFITHAGNAKRRKELATGESVIGFVLEPSDDPDFDEGETRRAVEALFDEEQIHGPWSYRYMVPGADALREYVYAKAFNEPEKGVLDE